MGDVSCTLLLDAPLISVITTLPSINIFRVSPGAQGAKNLTRENWKCRSLELLVCHISRDDRVVLAHALDRQLFAQQCLNSFLKMLGKMPRVEAELADVGDAS